MIFPISHDLKQLAKLEDVLSDLRAINGRTNPAEIIEAAFNHCPSEQRNAVVELLKEGLTKTVGQKRAELAKRLTAETVD